jgi:hypothetical protein
MGAAEYVSHTVDDGHAFSQGDVVKVRDEEELSVVILPSDGSADFIPEDIPEPFLCCVPIALVGRFSDGRDPRWVEPRDLTRADPEDTNEENSDD